MSILGSLSRLVDSIWVGYFWVLDSFPLVFASVFMQDHTIWLLHACYLKLEISKYDASSLVPRTALVGVICESIKILELFSVSMENVTENVRITESIDTVE